MEILKINSCPLCGGQQLEHALTCTDHYASGETFEVVRCMHCGFLITQNVPVEAEIYHWVRRYMLSRKATLVKRISKMSRGTLLDYGTGTGYFAQTMIQKQWTVKAIEKSPQARTFALNHFGLKVDAETEFPNYQSQTFDVATLRHVMEHLEHLNET